MKYDIQKLALGSRMFELSRSEKINSGNAKIAYNEAIGSIDLGRDALFVRRQPVSFRPLDPDHPEHGYISEDNAGNELWHVKNCDLVDSVAIATTLLDCPSPANFAKPNFERLEILAFLKTLRGFEALTLEYVSEDLLGFRYYADIDYCTRAEFNKIIDFNERSFKRDKDAKVQGWLWTNFSKDKKFTVGVA